VLIIALPFTSEVQTSNKGCVTLWPLPFYIEKYLEAKEELWKFKYFTVPKCDLQKKIV
jgi:hypothetical protein